MHSYPGSYLDTGMSSTMASYRIQPPNLNTPMSSSSSLLSSNIQSNHSTQALSFESGILESRPTMAAIPGMAEESSDDILDKLEQAGRVPSKEKFRRMACNTFIYTGACPYNDRCVFLHDYRVKTEGAKVRTTRQTKINSTIKDTFYWPDMVRKDVSRYLDAQGLPSVNQMYIIPEQFKFNPHNFHNRGLYSVWAHFVEYCIHNNVLTAKRFTDVSAEPFFEMSNYRDNPHVPQAKRLAVFLHLSMTKPSQRGGRFSAPARPVSLPDMLFTAAEEDTSQTVSGYLLHELSDDYEENAAVYAEVGRRTPMPVTRPQQQQTGYLTTKATSAKPVAEPTNPIHLHSAKYDLLELLDMQPTPGVASSPWSMSSFATQLQVNTAASPMTTTPVSHKPDKLCVSTPTPTQTPHHAPETQLWSLSRAAHDSSVAHNLQSWTEDLYDLVGDKASEVAKSSDSLLIDKPLVMEFDTEGRFIGSSPDVKYQLDLDMSLEMSHEPGASQMSTVAEEADLNDEDQSWLSLNTNNVPSFSMWSPPHDGQANKFPPLSETIAMSNLPLAAPLVTVAKTLVNDIHSSYIHNEIRAKDPNEDHFKLSDH